ncbi:MAG: phosphoribosylglycinamide formyltransferase [Candidatus Magnetominusculus sp. LBB02]|nr:phosphoribosylglycinamide formyltransferase [Candidatus Magnetominusculus sp. LBB02]
MFRIGVLASGRGSNFQSLIDSIDSGAIKAEVACLITDNPDAYATERAKRHNIPHVYMNPASKDMYYNAIADELTRRGVELVALAGFMRVVKKPLIAAFPMRIMNIHPALLPSFKGLHAQRQALDYGVKIAGCTVHFVDEGVDTGPIILQEAVPVLSGDTEETLSARILECEHRIYPRAIKLFIEGKLKITGNKVIVEQ